MNSSFHISERIALSRGRLISDRLGLASVVRLQIGGRRWTFANHTEAGLLEALAGSMDLPAGAHIRPEELFAAAGVRPGEGSDGGDGIIYRLSHDGAYRTLVTSEIAPQHGGVRWQGLGAASLDLGEGSPSPSASPSPSPGPAPTLDRIVLGRGYSEAPLGFTRPFGHRDTGTEAAESLPLPFPYPVEEGDEIVVEWELYFEPLA